MKVVFTAGSLRRGSLNKLLAHAGCDILKAQSDITAKYIDLLEFNIPLYNGDLEATKMPEGVLRLADELKDATHLVVSTPEYNGSMSPVTKNMIDWMSRMKDSPWKRLKVLLLGASPGALGAIRGLMHSQMAFQLAGAQTWPRTFGLAKANEKFDASGVLASDESAKVAALLKEFLN